MFPFPAGIGQVLETYAEIRDGLPMGRAFEAVADRRGITPATVRSACTRNLGLSAAKFKVLTGPGRERDFRRLILSRFPLLRRPIDEYLSALPMPVQGTADEDRDLPSATVADLLYKWSDDPKIPADIRKRMRMLARSVATDPV